MPATKTISSQSAFKGCGKSPPRAAISPAKKATTTLPPRISTTQSTISTANLSSSLPTRT